MGKLELKKAFVLDDRVKALPLVGLEAFLQSKKLQLKSENYTFLLALWWTWEQEGSYEEKKSLLKRLLLNTPRYARMSGTFLGSIVGQIPEVIAPGLLPSIMTRAFYRRRDESFSFAASNYPSSRVRESDRQSYTCSFKTHFTAAAVEALTKPEDQAYAALGLLHGFPLALALALKEEKDDEDEDKDHGDEHSHDRHSHRLYVFCPMLTRADGLFPSFECMLISGTLGATPLTAYKQLHVSMKAWPLISIPADALAYNDEEELWVELHLKIVQHQGC